MTQEKNTIQPLDFIIIYIGGAFIAGWLQQLLRQLFPVLAEATAGRLVSGLWLQNGLMLLFLVLALHLRSASWQDIGARPLKDWKPILGAILAGYLIYLLMTLAMNFLNSFLPNGLDAQNVSAYMQAGDALWVKAFVLITMGVFGPPRRRLQHPRRRPGSRSPLHRQYRDRSPEGTPGHRDPC